MVQQAENILIAGLGGQGIVTLGNLMAGHALAQGLRVSLFHAKGMAHRGGRVSAEIRMAGIEAHPLGPRIPPGTADVLLGLEIAETLNAYPLLKEQGLVIAVNYAYIPAETALKKGKYPSPEELRTLFHQRTAHFYWVERYLPPLNLFTLGVLAGIRSRKDSDDQPRLPAALFSCSGMVQGIRQILGKGSVEVNLEAFRGGYEYGSTLRVT